MDDDFLEQLETCTLPDDRFHHADHVRAAWLYLTRYPTLTAMDRFSQALRAYATSRGKPERYHETITWAYLLLINERIQSGERTTSWPDFADRNPDLLDWRKPILERYYRKETLDSALARRVFVMPDSWRRDCTSEVGVFLCGNSPLRQS